MKWSFLSYPIFYVIEPVTINVQFKGERSQSTDKFQNWSGEDRITTEIRLDEKLNRIIL